MNNLTPQKSDILLLSAPKKAKNISILAPFPARFFSLIIIFILTSIFSISHMLPDVRNLDNHFAPQSTEILDRNGNVLYVVHGDENRKKITFNEISPYLVNATLAIEDDRFYSHHGFDIYGTGQAALHEIFGVGEKRGGSTITQQYIKNTFLTP